MFSSLKYKFSLAFCVVTFFACSQKDTSNKTLWGQAGLLFNAKSRDGVAFHTGLNFEMKRNMFSIRYYYVDEIFLPLFKQPKINNYQQFQSLAFSYGYEFSTNEFKVFPSIGLSVGQAIWRNGMVDTSVTKSTSIFGGTGTNYTYHYDRYNFIGVLANITAILKFSKYFGIGVDLFFNQHRNPDYGFSLSLHIGRLE